MYYFLLFLLYTIHGKNFNWAYALEGPHKKKVNLHTMKIFLEERKQLSNNHVMQVLLIFFKKTLDK